MRAWPDGGLGRFYYCPDHGVLARRQTRMVGSNWRSCRYCLNRRDRVYYRAHPEKRRQRQEKAFRHDPRHYAEGYAKFNAEQIAWTERFFLSDFDLEEKLAYAGTAPRTARTFEVLNARIPTWPQWASLLAAILAPITEADRERWSHDADLKREAKARARAREAAAFWERQVQMALKI